MSSGSPFKGNPDSSSSLTFITLVKDWDEYTSCRQSIENLTPNGFQAAIDPIDNRGNRYSCPEAYNLAWERAHSEYLVFCHEDVIFPPDWLAYLRQALEAIHKPDYPWGVLGAVGRISKRFFGHCTDLEGIDRCDGPLPAVVETLDELCLIVRRDLPLRFDEKLGGYHLYGVDLCIQAWEKDLCCFAADLPLRHNSLTTHRPPAYHRIKKRLQRKWMFRRKKIGKLIYTPCGRIRFGLLRGWF